jgi:hypothetical protein
VKIRGSALLAASATAAALAFQALGTHASLAAPAAAGATYLVTLTGTQQSVASYAGSMSTEAGCTYRVNNIDRQVLTFSAERRARLVLRADGSPPEIHFTARVRVAGSRHRESELTKGDPDTCDASQPARTSRCGSRILRADITLHPVGGGRVVLDGGLAAGGDSVACSPTLTKPDRFLLPSGSRLTVPPALFGEAFAKGRLHATTRAGNGITKTTDVRWTVVLKRLR